MHLVYDFKELAKKNNWANPEMDVKFNAAIRSLMTLQGIPDGTDKYINGVHLKIYKDQFVFEIRKLTDKSDEYIKELESIVQEVIENKYDEKELAKQFMKSLCFEPCNRCGKTPRNDFDGLCMDCADELRVSDLFMKSDSFKENLKKAEPFLNSVRNKIGNTSMQVKAIKGGKNG